MPEPSRLPCRRARHAAALAATSLLAVLVATAAAAQNLRVTVNVDAASNRHPISPGIYGVAYGGTDLAQRHLGLNRQGGNTATSYNWKLDAVNSGSDWFFESVHLGGTAGLSVDDLVGATRSAHADAMVTIPMIDWVAKLGPGQQNLASFSVARYGRQTGFDPWWHDAGSGVLRATGANIANDPNDASTPNNTAFQQDWVRHLVSTWGTAAGGGVRYYLLDNEPSLWHAIHRDVHPVGATMDEVVGKSEAYSAAIKALDPTADVCGPEEWGWSAYQYSGYDQQYGQAHGWSYLPDRAAHGGVDFIPYYLSRLRAHDQASGTGLRTIDALTVHFYPQDGSYWGGTDVPTQMLRNRSTRSLWDPHYTDQSWIGTQVMLIPRLKRWVATYYPGLGIGITEYNWGAEGHINGATTQADILGIFGREGLDMAARWTDPAPGSPVANAFAMYRSYDGAGSAFGDTSVQAAVPNPDSLSAFAALRSSDNALTVMLVNKVLSGATQVTLKPANFTGSGQAQEWQLTASNVIRRLGDMAYSASGLSLTVPAQSITLLVLPPGHGSSTPPPGAGPPNPAPGPGPLPPVPTPRFPGLPPPGGAPSTPLPTPSPGGPFPAVPTVPTSPGSPAAAPGQISR